MAHPSTRRRRKSSQSIRRELNDLVRGVSGGFLFGIPLLYTVEVWWIGSAASPPVMMMAIAVTMAVVFLLNLTQGFRRKRAVTLWQAFDDSMSAMALGLICSTLMLVLLQEITGQTQLREALGKIVFEGVPFTLGVALANQFLQGSDPSSSTQNESQSLPSKALERFFPENNLNETVADIGASFVGALIVAFGIAPTDEVSILVSAVQGPWLLGIVMTSLILSYMIVFQANFTSQSQRKMQKGLFQSPISETVVSYLIALLTSALLLAFFQQIDGSTPWHLSVRYILLLGLPATIGGAAGRLVL